MERYEGPTPGATPHDPIHDGSDVMQSMWEGLPIHPAAGTVGVKLLGDESGRDHIRQAALNYLERSGVPTTELASAPTGGASTGEILAGAFSIIVGAGSALADVVGVGTAGISVGKYIQKEVQRRERDRLAEHLPEVVIRLDDNRGRQANALQLLQIVNGLEVHLTAEHPHRRYRFSVASSTHVIKYVILEIKASDLNASTERALIKHLQQNEHADWITLEPKRNSLGRIYIAAHPYPPAMKMQPRRISMHPLHI